DGFRSVWFVNTETALHEKVRTILEQQFGYQAVTRLNEKYYDALLPQGKCPQRLRDCYTTWINNKLICEALRAVQRKVLELPAPLVGAWLRGVFDGDGCVRTDRRSPQVIISAWDQQANQFIRDALLRVGIVTSCPETARNGDDGNIVITGRQNLKTFQDRVGSAHPEKQAKLHKMADLLSRPKTSSSRLDGVPVGALLRQARLSIGMGQRMFCRGHYVSAYERGQVTPSRTSLQQ